MIDKTKIFLETICRQIEAEKTVGCYAQQKRKSTQFDPNKQCIEKKKWTTVEEEFLLKYWKLMTDQQLARHLFKTECAIQTKRARMKLYRIKG